MDTDIDAIMRALRAGNLAAASASADNLDGSSERVADRLSEAIDANVAEASRLAAVIRWSRHRGIVWAVTLDSAGVMLAAFAAALALRVSRAHARAVHAYREMAERRADELELFATRMAHDVRTPLTAAGLAVDVIERHGPGDEQGRRAVGRARSALGQTTKIVEGLLEFARAGAAPQLGARTSVADVAEEIAVVLRSKADQMGADLVVRAASHASVACAEGVLSSALANLVTNALTYVDGAVTRRVVIDVREDGGHVKITVSDTGSGLPTDVVPESLFEPYVRGDGARGRGLGLGLATVKRIVDAHGGRLGVQSSANGAQFWFTLPVAHKSTSR
jgi:signal transduction histidine kinase